MGALQSDNALGDSWQPRKGIQQVPVWPKGAAVLGNVNKSDDEKVNSEDPIKNVSNPTYSVYSPKENKSGIILNFCTEGNLSEAVNFKRK